MNMKIIIGGALALSQASPLPHRELAGLQDELLEHQINSF